jgi:hypothetical protein
MKLKKFIQFNENMDMNMDMNVDMQHEHDSETTYYMFFQNLATIKRLVDELLQMDETEIDEILVSGHDWASDHIAVAKVDVEQVFNFLTHNTEKEEHGDEYHEMEDDDMENHEMEDDDMENHDMEDYDMEDDDMEDDDMEDFSSDDDDE